MPEDMTECTSLLHKRRSSYNAAGHYHTLNSHTLPSTLSLPLGEYENNSAPATFLTPSQPITTVTSPRFNIFNKRHGVYDEDRQDLVNEYTGIRVWSDSYSSIDWIHDRIKEGIRLRKLRNRPGIRGQWMKAKDASQAWILVILIGTVVAGIAWFIDVVQEWMSDLKQGYCSTNWRYNEQFCCWDARLQGHHTCDNWITWSDFFGAEGESSSYYIAMAAYTAFGLLFSWVAALMVKYSAEEVITRVPISPQPFFKSPSRTSFAHDNISSAIPFNVHPEFQENLPASRQEPQQERYNEKTIQQRKKAFYSAGSGIPEVKVILGGFVIKGFLGIKTLIVKSIGNIFSTSAGLTCGKEGPFVHLACSVGNIFCRLFPKFNKNESKRREILSAAAAAGVSVAFGAPIGGVLFSLEEVSYYFPIKTMIRSYCCAMVAATVLKISDPFGTGKIVLFQVVYDKEYHLFELFPFLLCGVFAGSFGAFVTFYNIRYQHFRKSSFISKYPVIEVLCIMLITAIACYWNPFARLSLSEFVANLFSECSSTDDNAGLCARTTAEIPRLLYLLLTALVIKMGLTVITFGCAVPGGVFLPALIIGAATGRIIGLIMQYLTLTYPHLWPFTVCADDLETTGECVIPGVYAMVGAAASLAGVTRTTVSLVVIMFELTYSLTYAVPIMIAVMVAKWVADALFVEGIYDLLIDMKGLPYLESRKEYIHTMTVLDLTEYLSTIDLDHPLTVETLKTKLQKNADLGYGEDGGFPIISQGNVLHGYIASHELTHAIDQLTKSFEESPFPITDQDLGDIPCYFRRIGQQQQEMTNQWIARPDTPNEFSLYASLQEQDDKQATSSGPLNDFSQYVDQAPLTINQNASMELLMEMFIKLGARYICVVHSNGHFLGIIHKRRLLAYLKDIEENDG
ncbi:chloride channel [Halteromyces radiatus]|uniref:chloride channel n=1 Tax=Halteromyces radiatus TaxID=101107 RepID=UPI0022209222|nr:chloride channel [Halteromyces radiatus]KAI8084876.1 chloride channel [Halteromyces radiatus]